MARQRVGRGGGSGFVGPAGTPSAFPPGQFQPGALNTEVAREQQGINQSAPTINAINPQRGGGLPGGYLNTGMTPPSVLGLMESGGGSPYLGSGSSSWTPPTPANAIPAVPPSVAPTSPGTQTAAQVAAALAALQAQQQGQ